MSVNIHTASFLRQFQCLLQEDLDIYVLVSETVTCSPSFSAIIASRFHITNHTDGNNKKSLIITPSPPTVDQQLWPVLTTS